MLFTMWLGPGFLQCFFQPMKEECILEQLINVAANTQCSLDFVKFIGNICKQMTNFFSLTKVLFGLIFSGRHARNWGAAYTQVFMVIICFIPFTGTMNWTNWTAPKVWVFIDQLAKHCSANAEAMASCPVEEPKTFFGLNCDCLNRNHIGDDHTFISKERVSMEVKKFRVPYNKKESHKLQKFHVVNLKQWGHSIVLLKYNHGLVSVKLIFKNLTLMCWESFSVQGRRTMTYCCRFQWGICLGKVFLRLFADLGLVPYCKKSHACENSTENHSLTILPRECRKAIKAYWYRKSEFFLTHSGHSSVQRQKTPMLYVCNLKMVRSRKTKLWWLDS